MWTPRDRWISTRCSRPLFATLSTTADGAARGSPVWFLWEESALWVITNTAHDTFAARIAREPRCAVSVIDFDPATGRVHHVGMRGRATVVAFDRDRALRKIERYLGTDRTRWPADRFTLRAPTLALVRFDPETIVLRDQSYALQG
ncbi:MAG: pyridoxamine 5'-phosphate oxidase family protein [Deltaproteobacteria bacterium]|nr:pyridoxamine 5'-phosphate oxidase family protein [Deltaproteobacteria bacterium]